MPARIIDDAIWASDKLAACSEPARADYAWLYPLADANGNFELTNLKAIHGRVACNRPNMTLNVLEDRFREYHNHGLLFIWTQAGKKYGHWAGSDQKGRLPPLKERARYKNCRGLCTKDMVDDYLSKINRDPVAMESHHEFVFDLVCDSDLDREKELPEPQCPDSGQAQEEPMSLKKDIRVLCRQILRVKPDPDGFASTWQEFNELAGVYDAHLIRAAFERWATDQKQNNHEAYTRQGKWPISEFLRVADGLIGDDAPLVENPAATALLDDMVAASKGGVVFDAQQGSQVARLLSEYTAEEVLSAFRVYWEQNKDDSYAVKFVAKKFPEVAGQLIRLGRRQQTERERVEKMGDELGAASQARAAQELADLTARELAAKAEMDEEEL